MLHAKTVAPLRTVLVLDQRCPDLFVAVRIWSGFVNTPNEAKLDMKILEDR